MTVSTTPRFSDWQQMRRRHPELYFMTSTQKKMHECFINLGNSFFDEYSEVKEAK